MDAPCDRPPGVDEAFVASRTAFDALAAELGSHQLGGWTHDQVEDHLAEQGRELLRLLFQDHCDLRSLREEQAHTGGLAPVVDAEGIVHRRVEKGHVRGLATVFGQVTVTRLAYRAPGRPNLYPTDKALNLPQAGHSHGLRRLAAAEAVRGSFDAAHTAVVARCGPVIGKRQVEELAVATAADIDAFYAARAPEPFTDATVLVLSADGKGVVMRPEALREHTAKAASVKGGNTYRTRLASGEKQGRKRMATLGCVYDAEPVGRRPHHVITLAGSAAGDGSQGDERRRRSGPRSKNKWLTGSIEQSSEQVIKAVFDQAEQRDPDHRRTWIMLVDGARHQLDLVRAEAERHGVCMHILIDFIHVIEYVWKAVWCFHEGGDPAAERWVAAQGIRILAGGAREVAGALDRQATEAGLGADQRKGVDACIGYLRAKQDFLGYDLALKAGWPIATGIIEGACRHLIGDRLDITGARWGLKGAEAVLKLRAMISNGDFDDYYRFHLAQERQRVHQSRYQDGFTLGA